MVSVAFCPTEYVENPFIQSVNLQATPFVVSPPPQNVRWVTHVSAQLASTAEPLVLIFAGEASQYAPAIGFSRRSLRTPAVGYVLIDPLMPTIGGDYGDWPDAPVTIVLTENPPDYALDAAKQAKLRGWNVTNESLQEVLESIAK